MHEQQSSRRVSTSQVERAWVATSRLPGGRRVFSALFARKTPYVASIGPRFVSVGPNRVVLVVPKRRRVQNHLGTVHAVALCTGLETATGTLAEASIPAGRRWIPKRMEVSYVAKATGDVTCIAETTAEQWSSDEPDLAVRVRGELADGTVVIEGLIHLWVTTRP